MNPQNVPLNALCAMHPAQPAVVTCQRCGNFMCAECSENLSKVYCPACASLMGGANNIPTSRNDYSFDRVWSFAAGRFREEWVMLSIGVLIFYGASIAGGMVGNIVQLVGGAALEKGSMAAVAVVVVGQLMSFAVNFVIQGLLTLGMLRVVLDVLGGKKADLARLFTQSSKLLRHIGAQLALGAVVFGVMMVPLGLIVGAIGATVGFRGLSEDRIAEVITSPIIIALILMLFVVIFAATLVMMQFALASFELVNSDCGAIESLQRSWALTRDHRAPTIGFQMMAGLVVVAGVLACCIGLLPAFGMAQLLLGTFYLTLRKGSDLPVIAAA